MRLAVMPNPSTRPEGSLFNSCNLRRELRIAGTTAVADDSILQVHLYVDLAPELAQPPCRRTLGIAAIQADGVHTVKRRWTGRSIQCASSTRAASRLTSATTSSYSNVNGAAQVPASICARTSRYRVSMRIAAT